MTLRKIDFFSECEFCFKNSSQTIKWLERVASDEGVVLGKLNYVFCSDEYLNKINVKFLNHDNFTDIITFDTSNQSCLSGDLFVSIDRVKENSKTYSVDFIVELHRVMVHGLLHLCGYNDKLPPETTIMRQKEELYLSSII